uniref:MMPL domain-containing protein n=1 Tax=Haemonchus contortus TaxID=6289 RepID=A0A7I4Z2W3_HAECO
WRRLSKTDGWSKHRHHDKGLLLYAVAVFLGSLLMCIQQIAYGITVLTGGVAMLQWLLMQFFWLNDLMVSIPPISLLLLSSDLRQKILDPFGRTKNTIVTVTVSRS